MAQQQTTKEAAAYTPPEKEKGLVHAMIERREFNPQTGQPLFTPFVHKCNVEEWKVFLRHPNGYSVVEVLHAPVGVPHTLEALEAQVAKAKAKK